MARVEDQSGRGAGGGVPDSQAGFDARTAGGSCEGGGAGDVRRAQSAGCLDACRATPCKHQPKEVPKTAVEALEQVRREDRTVKAGGRKAKPSKPARPPKVAAEAPPAHPVKAARTKARAGAEARTHPQQLFTIDSS
eukprot:gene10431-13238_t